MWLAFMVEVCEISLKVSLLSFCYPGYKGFTVTSQKCSRLLRVSCPSFSEKFMKIRLTVFLQCCRIDCFEKVRKKSCVQGVKWNIPKIFPIVPCIKSHLPWKFHENPLRRFSVILLTDRQTNRQSNENHNVDSASTPGNRIGILCREILSKLTWSKTDPQDIPPPDLNPVAAIKRLRFALYIYGWRNEDGAIQFGLSMV